MKCQEVRARGGTRATDVASGGKAGLRENVQHMHEVGVAGQVHGPWLHGP